MNDPGFAVGDEVIYTTDTPVLGFRGAHGVITKVTDSYYTVRTNRNDSDVVDRSGRRADGVFYLRRKIPLIEEQDDLTDLLTDLLTERVT